VINAVAPSATAAWPSAPGTRPAVDHCYCHGERTARPIAFRGDVAASSSARVARCFLNYRQEIIMKIKTKVRAGGCRGTTPVLKDA
jgi:hypothetical protein